MRLRKDAGRPSDTYLGCVNRGVLCVWNEGVW